MKRRSFHRQLYFWVLVGMALGALTGLLLPSNHPLHFNLFGAAVSLDGTSFKPLSDGFIKLIRMMIAPIIFTMVVTGIAGMGNLKRLGRIGVKAFIYFEVMTTVSLFLGWAVAEVIRPGAGLNIDPATLSIHDLQSTLAQAHQHHNLVDFVLGIIPRTMAGAFAEGELLQVLFISVLFGIALAGVGEGNRSVIRALEQVSKALMRMIAIIIKLAPFAVFGAMSFTVAKFGLTALQKQAWLMLCVYGTCIAFVVVCLGALLLFNGISIFKFIRYVREELLIVFGTASSEAVLPMMMERMENLGCSKPLVGLVLPAGYTFNLDGSSVYLTMGALFIAQATNTHLTFAQEFAVLLVCLLTSKGAATVVGSAFITLTATLATMKTIPVEGMILILGVDWFMAQARAMTNMVGNGVATIVVAKWENEFDAARAAAVLNSPGTGLDPSPPLAPAVLPATNPEPLRGRDDEGMPASF